MRESPCWEPPLQHSSLPEWTASVRRTDAPSPNPCACGERQAGSRPLPSPLCPGSQKPQVLKPSSTFTPIKSGAGSVTVAK